MRTKSFVGTVATVLVLIAVGLATSRSSGARQSITSTGQWYEDNNMAEASGAPADCAVKFLHPQSWAAATRVIDVYYVRANVLRAAADDTFLQHHFLPVLAHSHIKLALDSGAATFLNAHYATNIKNVDADVTLLERLRKLGGKVDYIGLQSTLSKPLVRQGRKVTYSMAERVKDIVDDARIVKKHFPGIKIGLIDALPTKGQDHTDPYRELLTAMTQAGLSLDFIHLDSQYELAQAGTSTSWTKIRQVEACVGNNLHLRFGLVATSRAGGYTSDKAFNDAVLDVPVEYRKVGGTPDDYVIMSWYPHPTLTVRDHAAAGQYPALKTVLAFHAEIAH